MPNVATLLKEEIVRLARKEVKKELEGLKKASSQYRSDIAALKRQVVTLEKQAAKLGGTRRKLVAEDPAESGRQIRFSAKRLAATRNRLQLSAADAALLIGVSSQTIFHWESGKTRPRDSQLPAIAAFRKLGKRSAKAALATLGGTAEAEKE